MQARQQSRGLFIIFERFYLNHIAAFDCSSRQFEERCNKLGLKCILLIISKNNMVERIRLRDKQINIERSPYEIEMQARDYLSVQERFVMALEHISLPTLTINTDSMNWDVFAQKILAFADAPLH